MAVVSSGTIYTISAGQTDYGDTVLNGGELQIDAAGFVDEAIVSSGGQTFVNLFGAAFATELGAGGILTVSSGGTARFTQIAATSWWKAAALTTAR
jgi:autotransporter passenger strand-loop-strand repeat protein